MSDQPTTLGFRDGHGRFVPPDLAPQAPTPQALPDPYAAGRSDAYVAGWNDALEEAYAGAGDDRGPTDSVATPAQWLRRLFDQSAERRLSIAESIITMTSVAARCLQDDHQARIADQTHAIRDLVDRAGRLRADHAAVVEKLDELAARADTIAAQAAADTRKARHDAAERAWDAAADALKGEDPGLAERLRDANPCRQVPLAVRADG